MAKPQIALYAPEALIAGHEHVIEIELTPEHDMRVDYVETRVLGKQGWSIGSGKNRVTHNVIYPQLVTRFMDRGVLAGRANRFAMKFSLPRDIPPSHELEPAYARLELHVRIGVPWWFDVKYHYVLPVRIDPPQVVQRTPLAARSTATDAAPDKPRLEISLASTRLIAGEMLTGSCAVFHLGDDKPRDVELSIVPTMTLSGRGRYRERTGPGYVMHVTLPPGSAGQAMPFQLEIPTAITPTFSTVSHTASWRLNARSGSFFGGKVELSLPLDIVDQAAAATTAKLTEAPRVADQRVAALFARFAARGGWHGADGTDSDDDGRIAVEREIGQCGVRLGYAYRDDGTFVVGRVAGPSLGLGLAVTPSSAIRHVFWKDIEVDIDAWDRAHHVAARSAEQAVPMLKAVVPALQNAVTLGTLMRWSDDELVFERGFAAIEETDLFAMGTDLQRVATALDAARGVIAPPVETEIASWRELARWLDGELIPGDLSIDGKLGQVPVELGLEFDDEGKPTAIRATAGNPDDASAAARAITLSLPNPAADVLGANVAEALVEPLTRWPKDVVELNVADGIATARLVGGFEPARVRELVQGLVTVLATLDPGAGPYR